jgi:hypothetical protein
VAGTTALLVSGLGEELGGVAVVADSEAGIEHPARITAHDAPAITLHNLMRSPSLCSK